jgi:hypothetical protein
MGSVCVGADDVAGVGVDMPTFDQLKALRTQNANQQRELTVDATGTRDEGR